MNIWLRRYLALGGTIAVLNNVARTHPSQTEMALWTLGLALVGVVLYRWSGEPSRPMPAPLVVTCPPVKRYVPPCRVQRPRPCAQVSGCGRARR